MGLCLSRNSSAVAAAPQPSPATAKVILPDGDLREYPSPARASDVLRKEPASASFLCCADDMDFEERLPAVDAEEELEPGQIYFVLPSSMLRRRLRPEDMAALAARASATLARNGAVVAAAEDAAEGKGSHAEKNGEGKGRKGGRGGGGAGGRVRNFVPNLSAILE